MAFLADSEFFFMITGDLRSGSHAGQSSLALWCSSSGGCRDAVPAEQRLGRGWHRVRPERWCWPRHKCRWESHQIKPFLVSILMPSSRAKSLVLLFKRTCLSEAGRPTREHSLLRRETPSCVLRVASLGLWKENHTTEPSQ